VDFTFVVHFQTKEEKEKEKIVFQFYVTMKGLGVAKS
jgi:hypothetical protein